MSSIITASPLPVGTVVIIGGREWVRVVAVDGCTAEVVPLCRRERWTLRARGWMRAPWRWWRRRVWWPLLDWWDDYRNAP